MPTKRIILYFMIGLVIILWLGAYALYSINSFVQALIVVIIVAIVMRLFWVARIGLRDRQARLLDEAEKAKIAEQENVTRNEKKNN